MDKKDVLTLFEFNRWANGRTLDAVEKLDGEAFVRDLRNSFPSVRDTLTHIMNAEWAWLKRWKGESPSAWAAPAEFPTVASLRKRFGEIDCEREGFLRGISDALLTQPFSYKDMQGKPHSLPMIATMQHVANHGTYHRGQITTMLRQLGATPVSTDLSRFYLEAAASH
jgi:uncharacterized damage-inducible protein DinB